MLIRNTKPHSHGNYYVSPPSRFSQFTLSLNNMNESHRQTGKQASSWAQPHVLRCGSGTTPSEHISEVCTGPQSCVRVCLCVCLYANGCEKCFWMVQMSDVTIERDARFSVVYYSNMRCRTCCSVHCRSYCRLYFNFYFYFQPLLA